MRILLTIVIIGLAYKGYLYWEERQQMQQFNQAAANSPYGFVSVLPASVDQPRQVLVLAPANCPSDQARRAEQLVAELNRHGIPAKREQSISFHTGTPDNNTKQLIRNTQQVLSSEGPPIIIGRTGKAAASLDEIIGQYRHLHGS